MVIHDVEAVSYADPWLQGPGERLNMLTRSATRVAYFYEEPNNSTFRYRAYNMVQALGNMPEAGVSGSYFFLADEPYFDEIARLADILVICRSRYCPRVANLALKFRARGRPVLFDVDDLVFNTDYAQLVMDTLGLDTRKSAVLDDWFSSIARLGQSLKLCDGAITTNDYLAQRIVDHTGLPVSVVPNFMNEEQLRMSDAVYEAKANGGFQSRGRICLGYFSGSPSHQRDFSLVESSLADVLSRRDDVELAIAGYIEPSIALSRYSDQITYHPFQDFVNLQRLIGSVEFNLMPLQVNTFTNCKSELKYFEAAAVGTLSIASPSFTYALAIESGRNGYLSMAHEWTKVIVHALDHPHQYEEMAKAARGDALQRFTCHVHAASILNALGLGAAARIPEGRTPPELGASTADRPPPYLSGSCSQNAPEVDGFFDQSQKH